MAIVVRSRPSPATLESVPTNTITRSADLMSFWVWAEQFAELVAVVDVPQASKVTDASGFAAFTAAVIPCTALVV
jgi:Mrp family chromosome partitioning ATPase